MTITDKNIIDSDYDIEPMSKLTELCELLKDYSPVVHSSCDPDPEYEYLESGCACITLQNPFTDGQMFIDLEGEFTVTCVGSHKHYFACVSGFDSLKNDVFKILHNELCAASLYYGSDKQWLGSLFISRSDLTQREFHDVFQFILSIPEFKKELKDNGGIAEYCFWNPLDNRSVVIAPNDPIIRKKRGSGNGKQ